MLRVPARAGLLAGLCVTAAVLAGCDPDTKEKQKPGFTKPPNRPVALPNNCPPNDNAGNKAALVKPPDTDSRYFMGRWTFVDKDGNDAIVTLYCIIKPPTMKKQGDKEVVDHFNDFFSFEIATSAPGKKEVVKVPPATPT